MMQSGVIFDLFKLVMGMVVLMIAVVVVVVFAFLVVVIHRRASTL